MGEAVLVDHLRGRNTASGHCASRDCVASRPVTGVATVAANRIVLVVTKMITDDVEAAERVMQVNLFVS